MSGKILVVDDEKKIAEVVRAYLEHDGFEVLVAYDGKTAVEMARAERPDLVVLDLMLPGKSGEEVCQILRAESEVAILMLTAKNSETSLIHGLNLGADDYMSKPFSPRELVARVRAVLRRTKAKGKGDHEVLDFPAGKLRIDLAQYQVWLDGQPVNLTPTEFKLLVTLARNPGRVYTRSQLTVQVHGYNYEGYDRTIDVHIKNLRQKIELNPDEPRFIKTVYGVGYKFEGDGRAN
ncbi:MAG: response regulator transcription factor [Firmicutes bacterium]|nr:response regulator transcription factor [Bacillota bacterium]